MAAFPVIEELEAVNLLVAVRHLVPTNSVGIVVLVSTDNAASAAALSSGHSVDPTLGACARELWLIGALGSFAIENWHKPGAQLQFADALSLPPLPLTLCARCAHRDPWTPRAPVSRPSGRLPWILTIPTDCNHPG